MNLTENIQIIVTESAFRRIAELASKEKRDVKALRVTVEAGGCSGFKYKYELTDEINEDDIRIGDEIKVVIDTTSAEFVGNATINFVEELGGAYFEIKNPNATSKCGCGNSFGV